MNAVLLMPAALAALAALVLPLLIHLARRQQQRPTVFAALRWLRARPKPRRRLRFDEPWLLAVRLLLLALLALWLARPALLGVQDLRPRLLVVPGVDASVVGQARADTQADARWLAPGFPTLEQPAPAGDAAVASLLREFDATLPAGAPLAVLLQVGS
ncbi:BatA domain-containing protein, partial [Luteimonas sp. SDU101]|uniref:BatA domain-containing protein n=1 Tax=Luteimonas sp. SDU101 TaxID=3422593 RepID=UPI003EB9EA22